ncbi:hypothetical protein RJ639_022104 [Escallonia herrerae]|uniref:AT-hook motif nuclear-localized protein n=1 Tax=Escallonia herrerae TaxID=1293975 RepID=A0AA88V5Z5_9ASTE|nr:hypothetical protein RJ639_022104 [Escallonia herrerae]
MSGSETFTVGIQKSPAASQQVPSMRLGYSADGTAVYKPAAGSSPAPYQTSNPASGGGGEGPAVLPPQSIKSSGEQLKRKRGRPRKYGPDGSMALSITSAPPAATVSPGSGGFSPPAQPPQAPAAVAAPPSGEMASPVSSKKGRGRPPGSSKKQQMEALGSAGVGFTPHIIDVKAGEDVSSKIMSFSQHGPRAVCVLSANGAISNVTLRQAATSGGTATYEGRFDILSLSGSFLLSEVGGHRSRTGGLSVSLAGPDGRVLGGCVAGLLTAASPVQVIVGSFIADGRKETKPVNHMEPISATPKLNTGGGGTGASSPQSHGTLSESSGGPASPLNQSMGLGSNNHPQSMSNMPWK